MYPSSYPGRVGPVLVRAAALGFLPFRSCLLPVWLALAAAAAVAPAARAQGAPESGSIAGTLLAPHGGPALAGVTVRIAETGASTPVSAHGQFAFTGLPPGTYTLEATGDGYSRLKVTDVVVKADQSTPLTEEMPRIMNSGAVQAMQEVEVSANPKLETLSSFVVSDTKPPPFTDANLDIPRGVDDVQPYYMFNSSMLSTSGEMNVEDFLQDYMTQDSSAGTVSESVVNPGLAASTGTHNGNASGINLRGLGTLQTLILIDGQRIPSVTQNGILFQSNINQVPLAAIDRIEVMPSSASAIYGSSAVGGAINIVLKKNYQGGELSVMYQNPANTDAPLRTLNMIYGFTVGSKTHVTIDAQYVDGKPLFLQDRTFVTDYLTRAVKNYPTAFYGSNVPFLYGSTPNIALDTAAVNGFTNPAGSTSLVLKNGTSLNSPVTYIPGGTSTSTSAATLASGLLANAGAQNITIGPGTSGGGSTNLKSVDRITSVLASINHQLTHVFDLYGDFSYYSQRNLDATWDPLANGTLSFPVPGNAPTNPFQQNVFVTIPIIPSQNAPATYVNAITAFTAGFLTKLPGDWKLDTSFIYDRSASTFNYALMNLNNTTSFGGDAGLLYTGALNPFVDTVANPTNVQNYYGYWKSWALDSVGDFNLRGSGSLFTLPGGRPTLTVGLEARMENSYTQTIEGAFPPVAPATVNPTNEYSYFPGQKLITQSEYSELLIPLVQPTNHVPLINSLEVQAALRSEQFTIDTNTDRYNGFPQANPPTFAATAVPVPVQSKFTSTNPTFGIKYQPIPGLTFRSSYSTAFVPPTFAEMQPLASTTTSVTGAFVDPANGKTYTTTRNSGTQGNPNLKPQTTKAWSVGVIVEPTFDLLRDFRFNLEYFRIVENNLIAAPPNIQILVNTPGFAPDIVRDPTTGLITMVTFTYNNLAEVYTDGYDANLTYRKSTAFGTFGVSASATITEHLKEPPSPGYSLVEYVGFVNSGGVNKLKANANVTWVPPNSHLTFGWTMIYYDSYKQTGAPSDPEYLGATTYTPIVTNTAPQGGYTIPSQMYHNVFARYTFDRGSKLQKLTDGLSIQLGVNDVFNSAPPFDAFTGHLPFLYSRYGSVRLRDFLLMVKKDF